MKYLPLLLAMVLLQGQADELSQRVAKVLENTPLIDGHNDIPWQYRVRVKNHLNQLDLAADLTKLEKPTHTDIARLRKGLVGGLFWSVYVPIGEYGGDAQDVQLVVEQIDLVKRLVGKYNADFEMAYTAEEVRDIHNRGKIASLIGMEGGHAIHNSLATLRMLYDLGARYMTLTHSKGLLWADSATDDARHDGLTTFGEQVVKEMNRIGMLVDLSHVSAESMRDALRISRAPIIFSHSSAYSITQHERNVPDDVLRSVAANNGIVMVNYLTSYVSEARRLHRIEYEQHHEAISSQLTEDKLEVAMNLWEKNNPPPDVTLSDVADHIDHIQQIAGIDHIGLGADYDGMPPGPIGLEDVSTYPALLRELLVRGYSDEDIAKIAGDNILRVLSQAEVIAQQMQSETEASDLLLEETID
ncbi:MAG: membrane dipeptidase [Gammaproteobacteria bacterium]|nr:membrane dipeptidase [Gammaproteobacteria bacterium]MBT5601682.1 membrane dipeptidase [Gammaproteobacteria bacterium]MBT6245255.1 membrane dipeptidase [Gammaproteobacteria bacterium]